LFAHAREVAGNFADIVTNPGQLATRQQEFFRHAAVVQTATVDIDRPQTVITIVAVDKQDGAGGLGHVGKKEPPGHRGGGEIPGGITGIDSTLRKLRTRVKQFFGFELMWRLFIGYSGR